MDYQRNFLVHMKMAYKYYVDVSPHFQVKIDLDRTSMDLANILHNVAYIRCRQLFPHPLE